MWKQRLKANSWKLAILVISILASVFLDVPKPAKAALGLVAVALAIYEVISRRRKRAAEPDPPITELAD